MGEVLVRLLVNPARCFHKVDRNNAARVLCQLRRETSDSRPEFQDVLATPRVAGELTSADKQHVTIRVHIRFPIGTRLARHTCDRISGLSARSIFAALSSSIMLLSVGAPCALCQYSAMVDRSWVEASASPFDAFVTGMSRATIKQSS